jgi:DNA-binding winged helix-turn-helix (wHTH) protein
VRFEFDGWVFDDDRRQLLRGSAAVSLSPKAFELLRALIARRPAAIAKAELKDLLWPQTFVSDANLPSLVAEIRTALGDQARRPRYLRTVQRFGYAFCAGPDTAVPGPAHAGHGPFHLFGAGRDLRLTEGETVLGRSREAAGSFDSASVSRHHARVTVANGQATVEDLGSKNGTFVNDRAIDGPTPLRDGDEVRLGTVRLTFRSAEEASTATVGRPDDVG